MAKKKDDAAVAEVESDVPACIAESDYPIVQRSQEEINELVAGALGENGGGVDEFDLDRIKIPGSGGLAWTVPTIAGDKPQETIEGVIVYWRDTRVYWDAPFGSGETKPPSCHSDDMECGIGDPGVACKTCEFNEFGSAPQEGHGGKACKEIRLIFLVQPKTLLPVCIPLPPTSKKDTKKYILRLASGGLNYYGVITSFGLTQAKAQGGADYSKAVPSMVRQLEPEELKRVKKYAETVRGALQTIDVRQADVTG